MSFRPQGGIPITILSQEAIQGFLLAKRRMGTSTLEMTRLEFS